MKLFLFFLLIVQLSFSLQRRTDEIVFGSIKDRIFPGAAVVYGGLRMAPLKSFYGLLTYDAVALPVDSQTIFDLASLTKIMGTTMMTMLLYQDGFLKLDDLVCSFIPTFIDGDKSSVTIKDLLTHVSGVQPDEKVFHIKVNSNETNAQAVIRHIIQLPLVSKPRTKVIYSCLNFYLLAHINELLARESQEDFLQRRLFKPLGIHARYRIKEAERIMCAPTAIDLQGIVHDPLARFYGLEDGTPGNAGLFACADDMIPFCEMILNGGYYCGKQILRKEVVDLMMHSHTFGLNKRRGLGFNILDEYPFNSEYMHDDDFKTYIVGHTGYTGTMVWIDLLKKRYLIFLTNRVYPHDETSIVGVRKAILEELLDMRQMQC